MYPWFNLLQFDYHSLSFSYHDPWKMPVWAMKHCHSITAMLIPTDTNSVSTKYQSVSTQYQSVSTQYQSVFTQYQSESTPSWDHHGTNTWKFQRFSSECICTASGILNFLQSKPYNKKFIPRRIETEFSISPSKLVSAYIVVLLCAPSCLTPC